MTCNIEAYAYSPCFEAQRPHVVVLSVIHCILSHARVYVHPFRSHVTIASFSWTSGKASSALSSHVDPLSLVYESHITTDTVMQPSKQSQIYTNEKFGYQYYEYVMTLTSLFQNYVYRICSPTSITCKQCLATAIQCPSPSE